jgi:hypothetical protein
VHHVSWARKTTKTRIKPKTQQGKKCKSKSNLRLKTQICKAKTWYMLKDDSNKNLF